MSTAEILSLISLISFIIAGVAAVLAVFFWFFFKIPSVIGDLSVRTAKKSIARRRASNERSGGKGYQPSATNANRGKLTDTMQHSRKLKPEAEKVQPVDEQQMPETGLLQSNKAESRDSQQTERLDSMETAPLAETGATASQRTARLDGGATASLEDIGATEPLAEPGTTAPLQADNGATAPLADSGATAPLADGMATAVLQAEPAKRTGGKKLTMLEEVILIHTDEVI